RECLARHPLAARQAVEQLERAPLPDAPAGGRTPAGGSAPGLGLLCPAAERRLRHLSGPDGLLPRRPDRAGPIAHSRPLLSPPRARPTYARGPVPQLAHQHPGAARGRPADPVGADRARLRELRHGYPLGEGGRIATVARDGTRGPAGGAAFATAGAGNDAGDERESAERLIPRTS